MHETRLSLSARTGISTALYTLVWRTSESRATCISVSLGEIAWITLIYGEAKTIYFPLFLSHSLSLPLSQYSTVEMPRECRRTLAQWIVFYIRLGEFYWLKLRARCAETPHRGALPTRVWLLEFKRFIYIEIIIIIHIWTVLMRDSIKFRFILEHQGIIIFNMQIMRVCIYLRRKARTHTHTKYFG